MTTTLQTKIIDIPTTSNGTTYGPGTNGNVISTNGTSVYWRGVTDNSSSTAVTSTDTNLITGRTLYYAGYVKSSGVTSVTIKTTAPLTGGSDSAVSSTGTWTIGANIVNNTSAGALGWSGAATDAANLYLINKNTLAYWNGAYSSTSSNLAYCNKGAFGTIVTYTAATAATASTAAVRDSSGGLTAAKYNALTLTAAATGFTIAGGSTTSKTLTVSESVTLKAGTSTYLAYYNGNNVLQSHSLAHFSDEFGSSVANKKNELILGNGTGKASNGSAWGQLALYSPGTKGTYLNTAENSTAWYTATLQAKTGVVALMEDVDSARIEIIRL